MASSLAALLPPPPLPPKAFLTKLKAIDGITLVETQTFTLMSM